MTKNLCIIKLLYLYSQIQLNIKVINDKNISVISVSFIK